MTNDMFGIEISGISRFQRLRVAWLRHFAGLRPALTYYALSGQCKSSFEGNKQLLKFDNDELCAFKSRRDDNTPTQAPLVDQEAGNKLFKSRRDDNTPTLWNKTKFTDVALKGRI